MPRRPQPSAPTAQSLAQEAAERGYERLHVGLFDLDGGLRERRIETRRLDEVFGPGGTFCNVVPQWDLADSVYGPGPFVGEAVQPDRDSLRPWPFEAKAGLLLAEFAGPQRDLQPRRLLARQVDRAQRLGFGVQAGFEFEWLVFAETAESLRAKHFTALAPWAPDNRCWDGVSAATHGELVAALDATLAEGRIGMTGLGMELGAGCLEATLAATRPVAAADEAALFKLYTKAFFRRRGLAACFMAQPDAAAPGLSGHIHLSLSEAGGRPAFHDAKAADGASATLRHFAGGVLALLPELAVLALPTVNSWRRLNPGNWAPRTATWSFENYSTAIRAVTARPETTRLEFRLPGADVNPHLGLALFLAAGLTGVEERIEPPPPVTGDGRAEPPAGTPPLPRDLWAASEAFAASARARALFGAGFVERYALSRRHEAQALARAVSAAEKARYFEAS
jgi:glutamine synthetase